MEPSGAGLMAAATRFRPSVRGLRPVAIRITSASMSATDATAVFIRKVTPFFSRSLRRRLAMSLSRAGRHSFRYSMTVTSEPKRRKTLANSMPMTPAPMIQRRRGCCSSWSNPVESTTRGSVRVPSMGSHLVSEPVAMMMLGAVKVSAAVPPATGQTVWASTKAARALTRVMLG